MYEMIQSPMASKLESKASPHNEPLLDPVDRMHSFHSELASVSEQDTTQPLLST